MGKLLFDQSDNSDEDKNVQLGTNNDYAKSFNSFRRKEFLKKLNDRGYNNMTEAVSSTESETTDDERAELDKEFDCEFFKTLASLKSKDPSIYDKEITFFNLPSGKEERKLNQSEKDPQKKSNKPLTLNDFERQVILKHKGNFKDDCIEPSVKQLMQRPSSPTHVEEERNLKAEFKRVLHNDDSENDEFGGIFKKRVNSEKEKSKEETYFTEWLAGQKSNLEASVKQKLEPLKCYWDQQNLPQSEKFLRDYIFNKGFSNARTSGIPTYDEIISGSTEEKYLSADEKELEKQTEFEERYNFRFEEPDPEFIKRFPRTINTSVRQDAGKRKEKRKDIKQRKQAKKEEKIKEIELAKEIKRKEIEEKIKKLKRVIGNEDLGFDDVELEGDFDPDEHDRRMHEIFDSEFYKVDEGEKKPKCPSDIEELQVEDWEANDQANTNYSQNCNEPHCEDDDFNMDCEYDSVSAKHKLQQELIENTKERKGRRGRRNRFIEMLQEEKPAFDPNGEKSYEEYMNEYYNLDCEDVIDDLPCRFKYVETTPNDFGLTIEEILLAKNKELNQWASLKKALQIRPDYIEKKDQRLYKLKARNEGLKQKILKSLYGEECVEERSGNDKGKTLKSQKKTSVNSNSHGVRKHKNKSNGKRISIENDNASILLSEAEKPECQTQTNKDFKLGNKKSSKTKNAAEKTFETIEFAREKNDRLSENKNSNKATQNLTFSEPYYYNELIPNEHKLDFDADNKKRNNPNNPFKYPQCDVSVKCSRKLQLEASDWIIPRKKKSNINQLKMYDERLKAYNINPRKFHKSQKFQKKLK